MRGIRVGGKCCKPMTRVVRGSNTGENRVQAARSMAEMDPKSQGTTLHPAATKAGGSVNNRLTVAPQRTKRFGQLNRARSQYINHTQTTNICSVQQGNPQKVGIVRESYQSPQEDGQDLARWHTNSSNPRASDGIMRIVASPVIGLLLRQNCRNHATFRPRSENRQQVQRHPADE